MFSANSSMHFPGNAWKPQFDPFHKVKVTPKEGKPTDHDHNLISSEGGQDTSPCRISGQFLRVFSRKCPETPNLAFSLIQNSVFIRKSTDHNSHLVSSEDGLATSACKILGHSLHAFSRKCLETQNFTYITNSKWRQNEDNNQQTVPIV